MCRCSWMICMHFIRRVLLREGFTFISSIKYSNRKRKEPFTNPDLKVMSKGCGILYWELNHEDSNYLNYCRISQISTCSSGNKNVNGKRKKKSKHSKPKASAPMKKPHHLLRILWPYTPLHLSIHRYQLTQITTCKQMHQQPLAEPSTWDIPPTEKAVT